MTPRTCMELGVCQNRKPLCADCIERPLQLAPGVIDGPYRRETLVATWARNAAQALRPLAAYLMGPRP
jgi:hypothetical protein